MLKAYRIVTTQHSAGGFSIYAAENPGKAKTRCIYGLQDSYSAATYAWITSCRRAPEWDYLAAAKQEYRGVIARSSDGDNWQADRPGNWQSYYEKPAPLVNVELAMKGQ